MKPFWVKMSGATGQKISIFLVHIYRFGRLVKQTLVWISMAPVAKRKIHWGETYSQMVQIGYNALPIVAVISFSVGLIIAMQAAYQLTRFGATIYVADLVGVSITRELGPLITAIIVSGRSGSAIAAEIGTMKVYEEIDALESMAINPIGFLVVPRTLAMLLVLPCLTIIADVLGIAGGFVLAVFNLQLPFVAFFRQTADAILLKDFLTGLSKSVVFALIISQIGAYQGMHVRGGAEGVGRSTTISVVTSIFLIILADVVFTALFFSAS